MISSGGQTTADHPRFVCPRLLLFLFGTCSAIIGIVSTLSDHPLLLIVSFDGFRYDFLDNKTMRTPNLDALVAAGVRAPWIQPRYISKTFPNHFSIATGFHEESHGIVANSFFDPVLNDTFDMDSTDSKWWDVGGLPLWVLNQMAAPDRCSGGMMWPGTVARIRNQTAHHVVHYDSRVTWNHRVDTVIGWFEHRSKPANLVYLYFEEPDSTLHKYGPDTIEAIEAVEAVDRNVGYLEERLRAAGLVDRINLIITSDHGMTDVPKENSFFMTDFVDTALFRAFGHSPVWHILPNSGLEQEVYDIFLNASKHYNFTVYKKEDIPETYHYRNSRRVMPIVVSMDEHYDLYVERDNGNPNRTTGNHGYNNSLVSMRAIFVARGPQFKQGYVSEPFENIDIFPLGCHLLGIKGTANNGTIDIVKKMLQKSNVANVDDTVFAVISVVLLLSVLAAVFAVVRLRLKMKTRERTSSNASEEDHRLLLPR